MDDLEQLILATLTQGVIPADGVALLNAHRATELANVDKLCSIDKRLLLMKAPPEIRSASTQHGRRLLTETATFTDDPTVAEYRGRVQQRKSPGTGAVALGAVAGPLGMDAQLTLAGYLHGYITGIVSAAIRLLPLSNSECQGMIRRLHAGISRQLDDIRSRSWREMRAFTPELDIASINHQHDDPRMFAS